MKALLQTIGCLIYAAIGVVTIYVGYLGVEHVVGPSWVIVGMIVCVIFMFPFMIAVFIGLTEVWGWHWALAIAAMFPHVVFFALAGASDMTRMWLSKRRRP